MVAPDIFDLRCDLAFACVLCHAFLSCQSVVGAGYVIRRRAGKRPAVPRYYGLSVGPRLGECSTAQIPWIFAADTLAADTVPI